MPTTNPITAAASSSSSKSSFSSKKPMFDVASMIGELSAATSQAKAANAKMVRDITALTLTSEADQKKISDSVRIIKLQENTVKLESQQTLRNTATNAGTKDVLAELTMQLSKDIAYAQKQNKDVRDLTEYREGKGGALGFIGAGLRLPGEKRQADTANKMVAGTAKMIQTIEAATSSSAKTLAQLEEIHTEATVQANDDILAATYKLKVTENRVKLAELNATALNDSRKYTVQKMEMLNRMQSEQRLAENTRLAQSQIKKDLASAETLTEYANIARTIQGKDPRPVAYAEAMISTGVNSDEMRKLRDEASKGADWANKNPKDNAAMGGSTFDSVNNMRAMRNPVLATPSNNNKYIASAEEQAVKFFAEKGVLAGDVPQDSFNTKANEFYAATKKAAEEVIEPGGNSPASAPSYKSLMGNEAIRNLPLHKKVLAGLGMADVINPVGNQPIDEQKIWDMGVAAVVKYTTTKGKEGISHAEFTSGIKAIFDYALTYDRLSSHYEKTNAEAPSTYNSHLTLDKGLIGLGRDRQVINLVDLSRIQYGLIKSIPSVVIPDPKGRGAINLQDVVEDTIEASKEGAK